MKPQTHRIRYATPKGTIKNNILIEAKSREIAEEEFKKDFRMEVL